MESPELIVGQIRSMWPMMPLGERAALDSYVASLHQKYGCIAFQLPLYNPFAYPAPAADLPPNTASNSHKLSRRLQPPATSAHSYSRFAHLSQFTEEVQSTLTNFKSTLPAHASVTAFPDANARVDPPVAPQVFRPGQMDRLKSFFTTRLRQIQSVHGNKAKLPHFSSTAFSTTTSMNKILAGEHATTSLVQFYCVEPAALILTATGDLIMEKLRNVHAPPSRVDTALSNKFVPITKDSLTPPMDHELASNQREINELSLIIQDDTTPTEILQALIDRFPSAKTWKEELFVRHKQTVPDIELVTLDSVEGKVTRVLSIEAEHRDFFSANNIRDTLETLGKCFRDPNFLRMAETGTIRMREIFQRDDQADTADKLLEESGRFILECAAREWRRMVQRSQTWGIVTSVWASIVIEIDWKSSQMDGDAAFYYLIYDDTIEVPSTCGSGTQKLCLAEVIALLALLNIELDLSTKETYENLCKKICKEAQHPLARKSSAEPAGISSHATTQSQSETKRSASAPCGNDLSKRLRLDNTSPAVDGALRSIRSDELRARIETVLCASRPPHLGHVFTRGERLAGILQAMLDFRSGAATIQELNQNLRYTLKSAYFDPLHIKPKRKSSPVEERESLKRQLSSYRIQ